MGGPWKSAIQSPRPDSGFPGSRPCPLEPSWTPKRFVQGLVRFNLYRESDIHVGAEPVPMIAKANVVQSLMMCAPADTHRFFVLM
jgi:hypothetical protein